MVYTDSLLSFCEKWGISLLSFCEKRGTSLLSFCEKLRTSLLSFKVGNSNNNGGNQTPHAHLAPTKQWMYAFYCPNHWLTSNEKTWVCRGEAERTNLPLIKIFLELPTSSNWNILASPVNDQTNDEQIHSEWQRMSNQRTGMSKPMTN